MTRVIRLELFREEDERKTTVLIANEFDDLCFTLSDELFDEMVLQRQEMKKANPKLSFFFEKNVVIRR